jgi:hypothetical protein
MDAFQQFKKEAMQQYAKTGMYPAPQEIEAEFIKTTQYKELQDKYAALIQSALNDSYFQTVRSGNLQNLSTKEQQLLDQTAPKGGVVPPAKGQPSLLDLKRKHGG